MLLTEVTVVYAETDSKQLNTLCGLNTNFLKVKACGAYSSTVS